MRAPEIMEAGTHEAFGVGWLAGGGGRAGRRIASTVASFTLAGRRSEGRGTGIETEMGNSLSINKRDTFSLDCTSATQLCHKRPAALCSEWSDSAI